MTRRPGSEPPLAPPAPLTAAAPAELLSRCWKPTLLPPLRHITMFYRPLRAGDCQGQPASSALAARCDSPTRKKTRTCNHFFTNQTKQNQRQSRVLLQMQGSAHHHAVPPGTCAGDGDTAALQPPSLTPWCRGVVTGARTCRAEPAPGAAAVGSVWPRSGASN